MKRPVGTSADELLSWIEAGVGISAVARDAEAVNWRAEWAMIVKRSMDLSELRVVDELTSLQATARSIQERAERERERAAR